MQVWGPSPQGSALTTPLSFPVSVICVFPFFFFFLVIWTRGLLISLTFLKS